MKWKIWKLTICFVKVYSLMPYLPMLCEFIPKVHLFPLKCFPFWYWTHLLMLDLSLKIFFSFSNFLLKLVCSTKKYTLGSLQHKDDIFICIIQNSRFVNLDKKEAKCSSLTSKQRWLSPNPCTQSPLEPGPRGA